MRFPSRSVDSCGGHSRPKKSISGHRSISSLVDATFKIEAVAEGARHYHHRLSAYYERELEHLRYVAGEFAREHPDIARGLSLDPSGTEVCPDPFVERLLEGCAFLTARVQLKLDAGFPRLTQSIFETVYPHYLSQTPSMAMLQFEPDRTQGSLQEGYLIPSGSTLRSGLAEKQQTRCIYTTGHDVVLWPITLTEARYHSRDIGELRLPDDRGARAVIRMRLTCAEGFQFSDLPLDRLVVHIRGPRSQAMRIYEQFFTHVIGVVVHAVSRPPSFAEQLAASVVCHVGFDDDQAMLPYGPRSFQGYRLLQEFFAFPQRFMFVEIAGLLEGLARCNGNAVDISVLLDEVEPELDVAITDRNFALFCTPAINLFRKRLDRIHLSDRFSEFNVVADRTAPLDYEIYQILNVTGYGGRDHSTEQVFESFYAAHDQTREGAGRYYSVQRVPRTLSERERLGYRRTTSYAGSEMYISLVDSAEAPYRADLKQLGVEARCTNRDLPLHMPLGDGATDFTLDTGAPMQAVRCLGRPTPPRASWAEGEFAWRLVSHLSLNYLSILDTDHHEAAESLRELLALYGDAGELAIRKQIDGILAVHSRSIVRRIGVGGPTSFARGLEITVTMDDATFDENGLFLLGAVLDRFFAKYVTTNVFTETVICTERRGEVKRWPTRAGLRPIS